MSIKEATHYNTRNGCYYKEENGHVMVLGEQGWRLSFISSIQEDEAMTDLSLWRIPPAGQVTDEDRRMVHYFIKEKDDITRWCDWEARKGIIEAEYPELIAALRNLETAQRTLDAIVERIGEGT